MKVGRATVKMQYSDQKLSTIFCYVKFTCTPFGGDPQFPLVNIQPWIEPKTFEHSGNHFITSLTLGLSLIFTNKNEKLKETTLKDDSAKLSVFLYPTL